MTLKDWVLLIIGTWILASVLFCLAWARLGRNKRSGQLRPEKPLAVRPEPQEIFIDNLIDDVLQTEKNTADWLDRKKLVIAEVFAKGDAWIDEYSNVLDKDDPRVKAHVTFSVLRAGMLKFYQAGLEKMEDED